MTGRMAKPKANIVSQTKKISAIFSRICRERAEEYLVAKAEWEQLTEHFVKECEEKAKQHQVRCTTTAQVVCYSYSSFEVGTELDPVSYFENHRDFKQICRKYNAKRKQIEAKFNRHVLSNSRNFSNYKRKTIEEAVLFVDPKNTMDTDKLYAAVNKYLNRNR